MRSPPMTNPEHTGWTIAEWKQNYNALVDEYNELFAEHKLQCANRRKWSNRAVRFCRERDEARSEVAQLRSHRSKNPGEFAGEGEREDVELLSKRIAVEVAAHANSPNPEFFEP